MDSRTLRLLELDKILSRLEAATACELGRARVRALKPTSDTTEARTRLATTSEAKRFLGGKNPPFGGITDVAVFLRNASIGSVLEPAALSAVASFAGGARRLRESILSTHRADFPILHEIATRITPRPDIEKAIHDAIDEATKDVKDDASLDILRARRNIRQTQAGIQTRLRSMLSDPNIQPLLQDVFVTVRDGRYCLPVRADARSRVPGIVHDRSGSGAAFFVEPQAVVEMNNRLRELMAEEREAVLALLKLLTERVAGGADDLRESLEACADLDFAFAKAHLSHAMKAVEPLLLDASAPPSYALLQSCHPLIDECVANDILLGDAASPSTQAEDDNGYDILLITGPNTGGKTVVLKTLGLLSLMAACGLHIPCAPGSRLRLPAQVFADIGDEQSIEQSLSTFSGHIKQIVGILKRVRAGDLVLLDEAGAGTDPDEGAALAKAVLRALQRRGAQVVATTHYGELKQFALSARRFKNASVEFDVKTLRPTYHLRIGVPGASNALDIAARLGMPNDLVTRARRYLGRDRQEAEEAAQRLEETQRELTEQTVSAQRERGEVERLRDEYSKRLAQLQDEMQREREALRREAESVVRQTQEQADAILRDLRSAARESKQTEEARGKLRSLRDNVKSSGERSSKSSSTKNGAPAPVGNLFADTESNVQDVPSSKRSDTRAADQTLSVGDIVRVKSLNKEGELLSAPDGNRVEVRIGAVKVQVAVSDIESTRQNARPAGGVASIRIRKSVTVPDEIHLIGRTTDQALDELDRYIDDAILADSKEVRVVHGKGTGALRNAIHRWLKSHRGVVEFHIASPQEGGEGATVVTLAS
ncbi:MAG TPA: endonuclease MutS2 [Abditibacteriaceae bacterium]